MGVQTRMSELEAKNLELALARKVPRGSKLCSPKPRIPNPLSRETASAHIDPIA